MSQSRKIKRQKQKAQEPKISVDQILQQTSTPDVSEPDYKVLIGSVHSHEVSALYMASVIAAKDAMPPGTTAFIGVHSGPKIDSARNQAFKVWLTETDATHFLFVDTDMVLPRHVIPRLLSHDKDIVGGLCFAGGYASPVKPTLHIIRENDEGKPVIELLWDYPPDSLVQVDGTGAACMMIKRHVAEGIWEARGKDHKMPWFAHGMHNGVEIGEDIAFCLTAGKCGYEVWVDTGLEIGHVKPHIMAQKEYVMSLSRDTHPYYNYRETVPIYQEMTGGQPSVRDSDEGAA